MTQPTRFKPPYDFSTDLQTEHGNRLDVTFQAIQTTLDQLISNLALIQRDDGALANRSVHPDSLSLGVNAMIVAGDGTPRGAWAIRTFYHTKDVVSNSGQSYLCATDHYSTDSFDQDEANGRWMLLQSTAAIATAISTAINPVGGVNSTNVQAAVAELDAEKASLSGDPGKAFSVASGVLPNHATTVQQAQNNSLRFMLAAGDGNAMTATLTPSTITALVDGFEIFVRAPGDNAVVSPTLTLTFGSSGNNTGPVSVCRDTDGSPLVVGSIAGPHHILHLIYSAALLKWQLLNPSA